MHHFVVKGMTCHHCKMAVTTALQEVDQTAQVQVDLAQGQVTVESQSPATRLQAAIEDAGYEVTQASQS
jgi:copper chaperone